MSKLPGVWPFDRDWDTPSADVSQFRLPLDPQEEFEWTKVFHYGTLYDLADMDRYVSLDGPEV